MDQINLGGELLAEFSAETTATRKCLERIPESLFDWAPHEKSMKMGRLAMLVAEIPEWIRVMIEDSEIDFATFPHDQPQNTQEMVDLFDKYMAGAEKALGKVTNQDLEGAFSLKNKGQLLVTSGKKKAIVSAINHQVHHRGQLTVYMRLNNIPVPAIYGPSADERVF